MLVFRRIHVVLLTFGSFFFLWVLVKHSQRIEYIKVSLLSYFFT